MIFILITISIWFSFCFSADVNMTKLNDPSQKEIENITKNIYKIEQCGICKNAGVEVFWSNVHSRGAHEKCYQLVEQAERGILTWFRKIFRNERNSKEINDLHIKMTSVIEIRIGLLGINSILQFIERYGHANLKLLFNSSGKHAIRYKILYESNEIYSPFDLAIEQNDYDTVKFLLHCKLNPNMAGNPFGYTPLTVAILKGNVKIVELLLFYGANPNLIDSAGEKPLKFATKIFKNIFLTERLDYGKIIKLLVDYGAVV